jgi:hypothetical protein
MAVAFVVSIVVSMASTVTVISMSAAMAIDFAMASVITFNLSATTPFNLSATTPMESFWLGTPIRFFRDAVLVPALIRPFPPRLSGWLKGAEQKGQHSDTHNDHFPHFHVLTSFSVFSPKYKACPASNRTSVIIRTTAMMRGGYSFVVIRLYCVQIKDV